ncbi:transposase family protein [Streptomyces laculatispora]|uniref:transposase family protein n=1 Tax=Streptomyces laculatispora TaxID=887464 RepID=UPI001A95074D|nr:transposase family protein [Streptomyces laculatispora]
MVGVADDTDGPVVHLVTADERARHCPDCGTRARRSKGRRLPRARRSKGRRLPRPRDLSVGGRRPRLVWAKRRWRCDELACRRRSPWTPRCPLISLSPHPAIVLASGTELSVPQVSAWL